MMPESTMMHVKLNPYPWKEALPILFSLVTFLGSYPGYAVIPSLVVDPPVDLVNTL